MTILFSAVSHFLEAFISIAFFNDIYKLKQKKLVLIMTAVILYGVEFLAFCILDNTIVNILSFFLVNIIILNGCYYCNLKSSIISSLFLSVALTASEFLIINLLAVGLKKDVYVYLSSPYLFLLVAVLGRLIYFLFTKIVVNAGYYINGNSNYKVPLFLFLYPTTTLAILYTFWIISVEYNVSKQISIAISIASIAILVSIFLTFIFYGNTSKKLDELHNKQSEAERIKTDITYYALLDRQNEALKKFTHDEKNHLQIIKTLSNNPDVSNYIDKIYGEIKEVSMFGNTKNKYLDLLLNKYKAECEEKHIRFDYSIKTANLSFMNAPDLISFISNILDNAVEAASQSDKRTIELYINKRNDFDVLCCTNSCDKEPISKGLSLVSTKKTPGIHGYGIKSIKHIVRTYDGELEWSYDDVSKQFKLNALFHNK